MTMRPKDRTKLSPMSIQREKGKYGWFLMEWLELNWWGYMVSTKLSCIRHYTNLNPHVVNRWDFLQIWHSVRVMPQYGKQTKDEFLVYWKDGFLEDREGCLEFHYSDTTSFLFFLIISRSLSHFSWAPWSVNNGTLINEDFQWVQYKQGRQFS